MRENFVNDERGVSEVIGAILVFGLLIALMAIIQTQAVPAANEEVEFNHNQDIQSDLIQFKEASSRTIVSGSTESTRIRMGATYPSRMLFFNPQNPGGTIRATGSGEAQISNVESPNGDVNGYIGDDNEIAGLDTKRLEYEPQYNEFREAPTTVMEYGALYNTFDDEEKDVLVTNEPDVVNGNTIDLTFFGGNLSRTTAQSMSLESRPMSAPARTVTIRPSNGDENITLTLPTRLSAEEWEELLGDEDNFISASDGAGNTVKIHLEPTRYQLRMAKIGVGGGIIEPGPAYITRASGQSQTLDPDSAQQLPIEVRDKFNNPVSGVEVNVSVSSGDLSGEGQKATATTDDSGRPMLVYTPDQTGRVIVNASYAHDPEGSNFDPENNEEDTQFSIAVQELIDQDAPVIDEFVVVERGCGSGVELVGLELGSDECGFTVNTTVSDVDDNLDTVEVRMINSSNREVVDSTIIDVRVAETSPYENQITVVDNDRGGDDVYDLRLIATDSTGFEASEVKEDLDADA